MPRAHVALFGAVLCTLSVAVGGAQPMEDLRQGEVGARVLRAANASPIEFVDALRSEGVSVGLHIRAETWRNLVTRGGKVVEGAGVDFLFALDDLVDLLAQIFAGLRDGLFEAVEQARFGRGSAEESLNHSLPGIWAVSDRTHCV